MFQKFPKFVLKQIKFIFDFDQKYFFILVQSTFVEKDKTFFLLQPNSLEATHLTLPFASLLTFIGNNFRKLLQLLFHLLLMNMI